VRIVVLGDMNARVGNMEMEGVIGKFGANTCPVIITAILTCNYSL
jgi:hypothetical protein